MMLGGLVAAAIGAACGSGTSERLSSGGLPEMGGGMATDDAAAAAVDAAVYGDGDGINTTGMGGRHQRRDRAALRCPAAAREPLHRLSPLTIAAGSPQL